MLMSLFDQSGTQAVLAHVADVETYFNRIIVSNDMILDHLSSNYDQVIQNMILGVDESIKEENAVAPSPTE